MIRIRFPRGVPAGLSELLSARGVQVTTNPRFIAVEREKNGPEQFALVEERIRPVFEDRWRPGSHAPFQLVSIETSSGCNHTCSFCPVAKNVDSRPPGMMGIDLLRKIAEDLASSGLSGRIALFGNNEPFLDPRLPQIVRLFRQACPRSDLRILSNGTLGTVSRVLELFEAGLDTLTINNYTDGRHLTATTRRLLRSADALLPHDLRVSVRDRTEVLTMRAGLAPNKPAPSSTPRGFCALPFTDLFVSYTGVVNLCSFDAYGSVAIGDVTHQSIREIWQSPNFEQYRDSLLRGERRGLKPCQNCDYDGFRSPDLLDPSPLTRSNPDTESRT
ncbi:radical SAM/SPASM domain-containing protein [Saccharothrix sp. 6-C]|uniref:radical SAM/SPASM domain-containing protein n=1 Tax=Saccharothrix sp. 6-C TaxID=2781735 RepID=UPI0019178446|nr:radical SAM/SPASM domain-containing protein [Saccharothrix sp. 6-C]QQQ78155.1 radical SAM/SPASM domain-containing protein [Saccharothrix sp. 6-C]